MKGLVIADGRFGRAVAAACADAGGDIAAAELPAGELPALDHLAAVAGCERVGLASWRADHALFERFDELAYRAGIAWSPVYPDGRYVCAGPVIVPPGGPCFACFRRRALTHHPAPERDLVLSAAYARDRALGVAGFAPGAVLLAAAALDEFFAGASVAGRFTRADVLSGEYVDTLAVPVHGCPRCGPPADDGAAFGAAVRELLA